MKRTLIAAALLLLAATGAYANHYADFYVIPVAGRTPGQNGTNWMSDVAIQNFQATPLTVQLTMIEGGESNPFDNVFPLVTGTTPGSVVVPANGSVLLEDVLSGYRGLTSVTGSILIGADRPFAVTSRSYSMSPSGDTVGQTVPPVRDFLENAGGRTDLAGATAYVPGLISNDTFRTNIGIVAGTVTGQGPLVVRVQVRDAAGAIVGTRIITVLGGSFAQLQFPIRSITDRTFDIGSADFRILEGNGAVIPYASVIDNRTADAVFVTGNFPPNAAPAGKTGTPSIFRELFERTRTR